MCFCFTGSFWTNPQYRLTVEDPGEDDEDGLTQVIVGLMQKDRRKAKSQGEDYLTIGYMMYKVGMNNADSCNRPILRSRIDTYEVVIIYLTNWIHDV